MYIFILYPQIPNNINNNIFKMKHSRGVSLMCLILNYLRKQQNKKREKVKLFEFITVHELSE